MSPLTRRRRSQSLSSRPLVAHAEGLDAVPIWKSLTTTFRPQLDIHPAAVLHRRLTAPKARREIEHHFGGAQCSIIGPISLIGMGIFRMQSIWNAPTTIKQRNALRNSYATAMPSFGRRIGLLRSTPRERAYYRRLVISSVNEQPRPRRLRGVEQTYLW
jgi:hypothetical protein